KSGTVSERMQALARDPQYLYPDTDPGRQQILDYCNGLITSLQPRLEKYFHVRPKAAVEIRRVPVYTEAGAPGGYYQIPALDGSRPGAFYINLRDTSEWSRWKLPTLVYHESEPGHHFQLALVLEMPSLPLIRKAGGAGFSANTEGWALYAEQLCDEMGLYDSEPLGRLGLLQSLLFRAARCVVDTGLHAKGWSRERAIDYMVATTGENATAMTTEVERYCTWPGQACSYKVGHTRWLALRAGAEASYPPPVQGDFLLKDFRFASGESLPELRIHYRTFGTPRADAHGVVHNAVIILHGTGGSGASLVRAEFAGELFAAGQPLDAAKYFIVLPDGIGHGNSSKPSDGLHARFPHYGYRDMVEAQYRLLTEGLYVSHARL